MPLTTNFQLPSPQLGDENDVPADLERLANAADEAILRAANVGRKAWQSYNPSLRAGETTLAANITARYLHQGYEVHYFVNVEIQYTPTHTGYYNLSLPMAPITFRHVTGFGYVDPNANGNGLPLTAMGIGTSVIGLLTPTGRLTKDNPTLKVGSIIHIEGVYRVAEAPAL